MGFCNGLKVVLMVFMLFVVVLERVLGGRISRLMYSDYEVDFEVSEFFFFSSVGMRLVSNNDLGYIFVRKLLEKC